MKIYRQTNKLGLNKISNTNPSLQSLDFRQNNQDAVSNKMTLQELINWNYDYDIRIICNQTMQIYTAKNQEQPNKNGFRYPKKGRSSKIQIFVGSGFKKLLSQCFQSYRNKNQHDYIFICRNHQANSSFQEMIENQLQSNERQFKKSKQLITSRTKNKEKNVRKTQQDTRKEQGNAQVMKKSVRQSSNRQKDQNLKDITNTYLSGNASIVEPYLIHWDEEKQQQIKNKNAQSISKSNIRINQDQNMLTAIPKFSFAKNENFYEDLSPINVKEYDTKLQNDYKQSQIENKEQIQPQTMKNLQNPCKVNEKTEKIIENSPLLSQFKATNSQNHMENSKRIQLDHLARQHEQQGSNFVQITEKAIEPNRSEYFVRYNFRTLQNRGRQTDVFRISPLKYKKKEESLINPDPPAAKKELISIAHM